MKPETLQTLPGHAAMFSCNVLWGLMSPVAKDALTYFHDNDISPILLPTLRIFGATICFWILSLFSPSEKVSREDFRRLVGAGFLSVACNQNLFVCGISFTSPIDASVMTTLLPVATMILAAIVLREPITHLKAFGVALGMTGAILLILSGGQGLSLDLDHAIGDLMCMSAQFSFAFYLVRYKDLMSRYSPVTLMKWMFLSSSVIILPFSSWSFVGVDFTSMPTSVLLETGYVVFVATFLTFLFVPIGQRLLRPTVVSSYNYVQPVVASVAALLLGLSVFTPLKALAVAFVFSGVLMVTRSKSRRQLLEEQKK